MFILPSALEELDSYKKLTEKLKLKIRDMGAGSKESKDFLDTFEEVMRDEMSAMKAAFEMKLRIAKEVCMYVFMYVCTACTVCSGITTYVIAPDNYKRSTDV